MCKKKEVLASMIILILGICLGVFSKYLDYRLGDLPRILQFIDNSLDLHNFLGEFSPWLFISVCISIYNSRPSLAALNIFFFSGFVASYYLYSNYVVGFFPRAYARKWIAFTFISPVLAFVTWHAKGSGPLALVILSGILSFLINESFYYGILYIDIHSWLSLLNLIFAIFVLGKSRKETVIMLGLALVLL